MKPESTVLSVFHHVKARQSLGSLSMKGIRGIVFCFTMSLTICQLTAQTDFAPGEIMFTGYNADGIDGFSFVLLRDVASGTVIAITDWGWTNSTGFRADITSEGIIELTFNADYPCGTQIFFTYIGGANDWDNPVNQDSEVVGTVVIIGSGDPDGPELMTLGDQLFIYQNPMPTSGNQANFITAIQMNGNWQTSATNDDTSAKPNGLAHNQVVRFVTEVDNAKYDCFPNSGTGVFLQSVITNDNGSGVLIADASNNWFENDFTPFTLTPGCLFCCGPTTVIPVLSSPSPVAINQNFTISISGALTPGFVWELFTAGCGVGTPLQTTTSNNFTLTAPSSTSTITYYVRSSETLTCPTFCDSISICFVDNISATCTNCSGNQNLCGDCFLPNSNDNPDLDSGCYELKLIFVLDESGSIGTNSQLVEDGVLSFLNALNGQNIQAALIEFSDNARLVNNYTVINNGYINNIFNYFNGTPFMMQTYNPGGGTNWHDAMIEVDELASADLVLFFTDGEPTAWINNGNLDYCGNGGTTQTPEIVNPVKLANKIKGEGTHMFMLGVGAGVTEINLQYMSGPIEYISGVNTIGSSDYSIGNFANLAEDLQVFVEELCRTEYEIQKQLLGTVCNGIQEFMFIIHNPGTVSAATLVSLIDTFPSGYTNIMLTASGGVILEPNVFFWKNTSLPPGAFDTIIVAAEVLPTGNYTNIVWSNGLNTDVVSDTVTGSNISDDLPPTISCPPNEIIECSESSLPPNTGTATSNDPDGLTPDVTFSDVTVSGSCPHHYTINRTWHAVDGCGNTANCMQVITVDDNTPPVIMCPSNVTIQCASNTLPAMTGLATSTDNCDGTPAIIYTDATTSLPTCIQEYKINRTWRATDECGNSSTCLQVITVDDSTPPVVTCPSDVTIECTSNTLPGNTGTASATDNCDASPVITFTDVAAPTCIQELIIYRTWIATDDCGNTGTCLQIISVDDSTPPIISCPANVTIECSASSLPPNTGSATASDNCGSVTITFNDATITSPSCPQEYSITRTWTATDVCGNSSTCIQMIYVNDSTGPIIQCAPNITVECGENTLPAHTGLSTATDNCDTSPSLVFSDITIASITCPQEYTISRLWTATDDCGNSSTCLQSITVDDSTPPVITCPVNVTIECTASTLPANTGLATGTDNCDTGPALVYNDVIGSSVTCEMEYTITRTWTSTDVCGNASSCIQIITIDDSVAPLIECPANITVQCFDDTSPSNTGVANASDNCDESPNVAHNDVTVSGPTPNGYTIQRTWTSTDACGNISSCLQIIIVENPIEPEIIGVTLDTICSGQSVTFTAQDQGLAQTTYQWSFGSGASPPSATGIGPHSVQYTYNGSNGSVGANVILTVSIAGCSSVADTVANVHVNPVPSAAITMTPTGSLCYYRLRSFKPTAAQVDGYTYEWSFGTGASIPDITGYGPHMIEYDSFGLGPQIVQLIVFSNEDGANCGDTGTISFTVTACPGSVAGRVRRPDNTGIGSVTIRFYNDVDWDGVPDGESLRTVFTSSNGVYTITGRPPGQYLVQEVNPLNHTSLYDIDETNPPTDIDSVANTDPLDDLIPVTIEPQETDGGNVFVDVTNPAVINGYVFEDFNNNSMPDPGEGISGVAIELFTDTDQNGIPDPGNPLDTAFTSGIGFYAFGDLTSGDYVLKEIQPALYESIQDFDLTTDNDIVANTNMTDDLIPVTIVIPETDANNYFKDATLCNSTVSNVNDDGPGSLRRAINCCCTGNQDTIRFSSNLANQVIHLTSAPIEINKDLHILSAWTPRIKIHSDIPGAFKILAGNTVEFKNLNFTSGLSGLPGAAFENYGNLILWDSNIFKNNFLPPGNFLIYNGPPGILTLKGSTQIEVD